jgi:hypothetical protein
MIYLRFRGVVTCPVPFVEGKKGSLKLDNTTWTPSIPKKLETIREKIFMGLAQSVTSLSSSSDGCLTKMLIKDNPLLPSFFFCPNKNFILDDKLIGASPLRVLIKQKN